MKAQAGYRMKMKSKGKVSRAEDDGVGEVVERMEEERGLYSRETTSTCQSSEEHIFVVTTIFTVTTTPD